ncbi:MAG: cyclic nucleotide-binding domain-containing protein, partial [Pseudomonadales bacterium]|nr:cyclic nucleotide-binding domain-containing protein [Pseudomonadales bacterium]
GIAFLIEQGELRTLKSGDVLFDSGDPGDSFYVVCNGEVDFYRRFGDQSRWLRTLGFGAEVGFVAMIALSTRSGKVVAKTDCLLLEISSALFAQLHDQHPIDFGVLLLNLTRDLARLVRKLDDDLLGSLSASNR